MRVSEVRDVADGDLIFSEGFSFFLPFLGYFIKEILEIGGEVYTAQDFDRTVSGLFIYDPFEKAGSVYTKSREVFDYFYGLKPINYVFAEIKTEIENEPYDIYTIDLKNLDFRHEFNHEISIADNSQTDEIQQFMALAHPGTNEKWVGVALKNGDKCFTVRLSGEIAGIGWLSLVNGMGRLHSLYVKPNYRKMRIGEDILNARLLWAKSKSAQLVFSEISRKNVQCLRVASKGHMQAYGQIYQYFKKSAIAKG